MKYLISIIMLILLTGLVNAESFCGDDVDITTPCKLATPTLSCDSYTYDIIDTAGTVVVSDTLTLLEGTIYYFEMTQGVGDYVIRLCDDTTREVHVIEVDTSKFYMYIIMIVLFLALITIAWITGIWGFEVLGGMLAIVIALTLWLVGYPQFSEFVINSVAIIFAGLGLFFILYPTLNMLQHQDDD